MRVGDEFPPNFFVAVILFNDFLLARFFTLEVVRATSGIASLDPSYVTPVTVWYFSLVHSKIEKTPVNSKKHQILVVFDE